MAINKWFGLIKQSTQVWDTLKGVKAEMLTSFDHNEILRWLEDVKFATSKYDKAMDHVYNNINKGYGGGNHRLFDGGHSLTEAWDAVQKAHPDDTFLQEVVGYMKSLWNDGSTVKGLPFQTLEKASYDQWVDALSKYIPGVSKAWLYDLMSFDAAELAGTAAGLTAAIFQLRNNDKIQFEQLLGSMGVSSIMGANPIMGICDNCACRLCLLL